MDIRRFLDLANAGKNGFWRYLLTFVIVMSFLLGASLIFALFGVLFTFIATGEIPSEVGAIDPMLVFVISMLPFAFALVALIVCVWLIHGRRPKTLLTAAPQFRWRRFGAGVGLYLLLAAASDLCLAAIHPGNYVFTFELGKFAPLLVLSLLFIPIQTSTEELLFRSYLLQGLGRLARRPWLPLLLTSLIFGAFHALNPEVAAYGAGIMAAYYVGFGILAGLLTLFTGGVELAIAMHMANNLYGSLFVTFPSSALPTPAMFTIQTLDPYLTFGVWVIVAVIFFTVLVHKGEADWASLFRPQEDERQVAGD